MALTLLMDSLHIDHHNAVARARFIYASTGDLPARGGNCTWVDTTNDWKDYISHDSLQRFELFRFETIGIGQHSHPRIGKRLLHHAPSAGIAMDQAGSAGRIV